MKEELLKMYQEVFEHEVLDRVSEMWQEKYGDDKWAEFYRLEGKLKIQFIYGGDNESL